MAIVHGQKGKQTMTEYIVQIEDTEKNMSERFVGQLRSYPELTRCKDCKHCQTYYHGENMPFSYACTMLMLTSIGSNDYCSKAERKEE